MLYALPFDGQLYKRALARRTPTHLGRLGPHGANWLGERDSNPRNLVVPSDALYQTELPPIGRR